MVENEIEFRLLNDVQRRQVFKQMDIHDRITESVQVDLRLIGDRRIKSIIVDPDVLKPMSSIYLAKHLFENTELVENKSVLDVGCGCGIQGITAAINGADRVVMTDINVKAVSNASANLQRFPITAQTEVIYSDLFGNITANYDTVIFAQPYFPDYPIQNKLYTWGMLDHGALIQQFFESVATVDPKNIIMCHLDIAGEVNDPSIQAPKYGYQVESLGREVIHQGDQTGIYHTYLITA